MLTMTTNLISSGIPVAGKKAVGRLAELNKTILSAIEEIEKICNEHDIKYHYIPLPYSCGMTILPEKDAELRYHQRSKYNLEETEELVWVSSGTEIC